MKRLFLNKKYILATLVLPAVLLVFSFNQSTEAPQSPEYKTEYIMVLVIDGPRITETFGDSTHQYIPNLANVLAPQGVLVPKFRNNGPTYTNAGHTAITTGVYQKINNSGLELPKNPSMFQYFLQQKVLDSTQAYVIASKGKLNILANTKHKAWKNVNCPSQFCGTDGKGIGYTNDAYTWRDAQSIFSKYHPKLTLMNLLECDVRGHQHQWKEYLEAIKRTDNLALNLWNFIQSDPIYKDKTTLFITNDHGRHPDGHKDGFVSHGDKCEGCRSIYLVAIGPDFKKNVTLSTAYEQIDISATIAELLGFDFSVSNGRVMRQLFVNDPQKGY